MTRAFFRIGAAAAVFSLASVAAPAFATYETCANTFTVINEGPITVAQLYMRPHDGVWGADLLGSGVLNPNEWVKPLAGLSLGSNLQDLMVLFADGHIVNDTIDVCSYNEELNY